jgi:adenine specific DNA methylase Mod
MPKPEEGISKLPMYEYVGQESEVEAPKEADKKKKSKKDKKNKDEVVEEVKVEEVPKVEIPLGDRTVNYKKDFFGKPSYLTVSG